MSAGAASAASPARSAPLLTVEGLQMRFGGLLAVDGIGFEVGRGEIFAIIGPNGAGKTTVFNCVSGFYRPSGGSIRLDGSEIAGRPGHRIARAGVVRTFQNIRLFRKMTAVENLLVAQHNQLDTSWLSGLLALPRFRRAEREGLARAAFWLEQVGLRAHANFEAGNLSYGQQRRLEIARCMITRPRLLLLDEPAAGLNPQETRELDQLIRRLRDEHEVSVLLIEHDMSLVMEISDRILVMEYGRPIGAGTPAEVRANPRVIKAYLGEE
ncbi:high-affinity branched-chain amino acid ABC transporter ATP-binding protein LivG [Plasticicumulans sp.]|uniref:high-affinity branched-chain amino acid ABC transporter ATP-binding protein LivG n=1 Tax=Plasticicumulans sp. TaxID=2307179 RepID=UPI002C6A1985|nr:high-affinity branched-chain amino acid ABC transporter ATP-binding protein LivG [Plasticicumulans sp.]MBS0600795.1 high-affinity branched-chain amino acid ABC transporter ATP-binding protein LivG [Pseudomonadota bacterium]HMV39399.1 high-affinity branched-chain amino acid ABC transporter ATP-binding protein LivG [Plasticicumulans sp.]HMW28977.1 high-affinity branched-chain amino acid ABC transporter ATP-binding protein LivG [Plasticicumulans sp.]HMW43270.1 high-affinity branched-chain amino